MDQLLLSDELSTATSSDSHDYKTRNILPLEERVQVIREFERTPVYQRIAEQFNCSAKQIRNIIARKDAVLQHYATIGTDTEIDAAHCTRQQKIIFLGKVIYEFVLRAVYHGIPLNPNIVRAKALEVKESIAIDNFYPNNWWLDDFKSTYKIKDFETLKNSLVISKPKKGSFKSIDIIEYVSQHEKRDEFKRAKRAETKNRLVSMLSAKQKHSKQRQQRQMEIQYQQQMEQQRQQLQQRKESDVCGETIDNADYLPAGEPIVVYEGIDQSYGQEIDENQNHCNESMPISDADYDDGDGDDDEDGDDDTDDIDKEMPQLTQSSAEQQKFSPLPDIHSLEEALRHLKVLEDFAMLGENYRAIGLLTQLERVLKEEPRSTDFDE